jgi:hypothetical protein
VTATAPTVEDEFERNPWPETVVDLSAITREDDALTPGYYEEAIGDFEGVEDVVVDVPADATCVAEAACGRPHVSDFAAADGHGPPHSEEDELALVGNFVAAAADAMAPEHLARAHGVADSTPPSMVYGKPARLVYGAAFRLLKTEGVADYVALRRELVEGCKAEDLDAALRMMLYAIQFPTFANLELHAKRVRALAHRRALADAARTVEARVLSGDERGVASALERLALVREEASRLERRKLRTLAEIEAADLPPPEAFVADRLLERGRATLLVAAPKVGKSLTGLQAAKSVGAGLGDAWLGSAFTGRSAPVVLLSAEGGEEMLKERSLLIPPRVEIRNVFGVAEPPFPKLDTREGLAEVAAMIRETGAGLLVVDPLVKFRNVADENDNAEAQRLADGICELARSLKVAVLIIHHPSRAATAEGTSGSLGGGRGATTLYGAVDVVISLRRDRKTGEIHATFEKRYGADIEPGRRLRLDRSTLTFECLGDLGNREGRAVAGAAVPRVTDLQLYEAVQSFGDWTARVSIEAKVGLEERQLRTRLDELVKKGDLERRGGGGKAVEYRAARRNPGTPANAGDCRGKGRA